MGARKKKDRRDANRAAKATGNTNPAPAENQQDDAGVAGVETENVPRVRSVSNDEFDLWMTESAKRAESREKMFREFTETPVGWVMLRANANRPPAHLFGATQLLATMPADPNDQLDYSPISRAWEESDADGHGDPTDFVACELPRLGLGELWNTFCGYEQFYMDVWSLLNAEESRDSMTIEPPRDAASMKAALSAALTAFRAAYAEQEKNDPRYLYAYDTIHIADDPRIAALLERVSEGSEEFCFGESDRRGGAFHFREASGASDHTATAAGYRAAVKVLRSYGIGCAQWSMWD